MHGSRLEARRQWRLRVELEELAGAGAQTLQPARRTLARRPRVRLQVLQAELEVRWNNSTNATAQTIKKIYQNSDYLQKVVTTYGYMLNNNGALAIIMTLTQEIIYVSLVCTVYILRTSSKFRNYSHMMK